MTVEARNGAGKTARLTFLVRVRGPWLVPLVPSASGSRQGFVRVANLDARGGQVRILPVDDAGRAGDALTLAIGAGETVHFNSGDLETGNAAKGLTGASGRGTGDWRLELTSDLDLDVLAYIRHADGFLTTMHDVAARTADGHQVPTFNPASNVTQRSLLRISNLGAEEAEVAIRGVDDDGRSPGGDVRARVPTRASLLLRAEDLEAGGAGLTGRLGDGAGKWRLAVRSAGELSVMSLLASPEGQLTNLSTRSPAVLGADGVHTVPLLPSASDPLGRQGFVRVVNRSAAAGDVRIVAHDDAGLAHEALSLTLDAGHTAHFNSDDLELGNPAKGLTGSTGAGRGDWRLELSSELDLDVLAYVRTPGGFLTSMHDVVHGAGRRHDRGDLQSRLQHPPGESAAHRQSGHPAGPCDHRRRRRRRGKPGRRGAADGAARRGHDGNGDAAGARRPCVPRPPARRARRWPGQVAAACRQRAGPLAGQRAGEPDGTPHQSVDQPQPVAGRGGNVATTVTNSVSGPCRLARALWCRAPAGRPVDARAPRDIRRIRRRERDDANEHARWPVMRRCVTTLLAAAALPAVAVQEHLVSMFPSASNPTLQGFVRVVNRSSESGEVSVLAFDDAGASYGPLTLSVDAGETAPFNSDDLEAGNAAKGLTGSTGAGRGGLAPGADQRARP